jgi:predicted dehydrogenase
MLNSENLDAVHITTPHYLHAPMAKLALLKNINVFLEKPMCISVEEINDLLEIEKKSEGRITICFQNRYNPATLAARKIADDDGGVISAYGTVIWERNEKYYTDSGWRGAYATEGGGVMINQAIHTIDLLCEFLGKPNGVCATKANHHLKGIIEVEDTCEGVISFDSGTEACFYATTAFKGYNATSVFLLTKNHKIEIHNNRLYVDGEPVVLGTENETYLTKACYGNSHATLIERFYSAIENGTDMPVSLESASYALKILLAAYESNDTKIDLFK